MKLEEKFIRAISKLNDPVAFIGIAKGFHIELMDGDNPRPFEAILSDLFDHFDKLSRAGKKQLIKLLEEAS